ncbi:MAG: Fe-S cluster assembly ATPase SufC [Treponema sp.]|nr:Fe-S cluster assembly ATPase SufC [Treponema sp.]
MSELLKIENLSVSTGEKNILNDVSLCINKGETHVLMGPNGAGKSTLGYTLMGNPEYSVSGGKIFFEGEDITQTSADVRAKKGIFLSFQEPLEVPGISLESFIRSSMTQVTGTKIKLFAFQKELERCMEILNINHSYAERDLNVGFSGGEKKKSEILQLLMLKPRLAILDETDSGLDVDAVRTVSKGIEEYQRATGGSLLIITHSTRILESLKVDKAHIMVKGHLVHTGDGSLIQKVNEEGFDPYIPQEVKEAERKEHLALLAKNAMDAVKANAARELEGLSMDEVKKNINGGSR